MPTCRIISLGYCTIPLNFRIPLVPFSSCKLPAGLGPIVRVTRMHANSSATLLPTSSWLQRSCFVYNIYIQQEIEYLNILFFFTFHASVMSQSGQIQDYWPTSSFERYVSSFALIERQLLLPSTSGWLCVATRENNIAWMVSWIIHLFRPLL